MSTIRTPIQVPTELRDALEGKKIELRANTHYEVIQKLYDYYHRNEIEKIEVRNKHDHQIRRMKEEEEQRMIDLDEKQKYMIDLGPEGKAAFEQLKSEWRFREDASVFELLRFHFSTSLEIGYQTFQKSRELP